jgi:hypothetical protein
VLRTGIPVPTSNVSDSAILEDHQHLAKCQPGPPPRATRWRRGRPHGGWCPDLPGLSGWLDQRMAELRTELVRWMFTFWVTNFLGIAGLLIALRGH